MMNDPLPVITRTYIFLQLQEDTTLLAWRAFYVEVLFAQLPEPCLR